MPRRTTPVVGPLTEQSEAIAYTRKWFEVYEWVEMTLADIKGFEWGRVQDPAERMTRMRAIVRQRDNDEVAYDHALPITALHDWLHLPAPGREAGGVRRVVIRIFAWQIDRRNENAHNPAWINLADDMSAYASRARAIRWATAYTDDLDAGDASREIRMTALEIAFWTTGKEYKLL